jgi:hypothetical protein
MGAGINCVGRGLDSLFGSFGMSGLGACPADIGGGLGGIGAFGRSCFFPAAPGNVTGNGCAPLSGGGSCGKGVYDNVVQIITNITNFSFRRKFKKPDVRN